MTSRPGLRRGSLVADLDIPTSDAEIVTVLDEGPGWRLERIVSNGHVSPPGFWYDQDEDELVLLIAGAARLDLEDGTSIDLAAGDWVELPAHLRHCVAWTSEAEPTVWLAHFSTPN